MVSNKDMKKMRPIVRTIKQLKKCTRKEILDNSGATLDTYNKYKTLIEEEWEGEIEYDKSTKTWSVITHLEVQEHDKQEVLKN